jgi:hypothetical protein
MRKRRRRIYVDNKKIIKCKSEIYLRPNTKRAREREDKANLIKSICFFECFFFSHKLFGSVKAR